MAARVSRREFIITALGSAAALEVASRRADGTAPSESGPQSQFTLTCQSMVNPFGVDVAAPILGWIYLSNRPGYLQSAYQIRVGSSHASLSGGDADLWNPQRVFSSQSVQIPYQGVQLLSRQTCFWQVRLWDQDGTASDWSPIARWTMGVLDPLEWTADWITSPVLEKVHEPRKICQWQMPPPKFAQHKIFYRVAFNWPEKLPPCFFHLYAAARGRSTIYINGKKVATQSHADEMVCHIGTGSSAIRAGKNILAIAASPRANGCVAAGITLVKFGGRWVTLPLDAWKCWNQRDAGWQQVGFDDAHWVPCQAGYTFGDQPWATPDMNFDAPRRSFMLRREFFVRGIVKRAVVLVSGLGSYELRLNGKKVGDLLLTPQWTQYDKRVEYDMFDLTSELRAGHNTLGAILGNSWWSSGMGPAQSQRAAAPGENLQFFCELHLEFLDGGRQTICSDSSWMTHLSPIVSDSIYNGETYDARLEIPGWDRHPFDTSNWFAAQSVQRRTAKNFSVRIGPPVRVTARLSPQRITEPKDGVYVIDFGQNHAGVTEIKLHQPAGTRIELRHAEKLFAGGLIDNRNLRSARATDVYICRGGAPETWMPRFTYHGYRYVEVRGLKRPPDPGMFTAVVFHSDCPATGTFACSDPLLNAVHAMTLWGQRSNFMTISTDCPQRDERLGWMGDGLDFSRLACWNQNTAAFYRKWTRDMADAVVETHAETADRSSASPGGPAEQALPTVYAPTLASAPAGCPGWSDAITIVPYTSYLFNADKLGLEMAYPAMRAWSNYILAHLKDGLFLHPTYGDWLALAPTPWQLISAAMAQRSVRITAKVAAIIAHDDAGRFEQAAAEMIRPFNAKFLNSMTLEYGNGSQCSNILPLAFGLTPHEMQAGVAQNVAQDIVARGYRLSTGFVGTPHLLAVLSRFGHKRLAARILSSRRYPSLGYMLAKGCTTATERWDFDRHGPEMNSLNHFALGSMASWLYESLLGVEPDPVAPGFKHFFIRPLFAKNLVHAAMSHLSPYGPIACRWQRRASRLMIAVRVPSNAAATIELPLDDPDTAWVTANGQTILRGSAAMNRPNIKALSISVGHAAYRLGAGDFNFEIRSG